MSAAVLGTLLIIPFRVPRELPEVIGPPITVAIAGIFVDRFARLPGRW